MTEYEKQLALLRAQKDGFAVILKAIQKLTEDPMYHQDHKHTRECEA